MMNLQGLFASPWMPLVMIVTALWDAVWKIIALWHCARKGEKIWFVALAIVNSMGILPLVYLIFRTEFFGNKKKAKRSRRK